MTTRKHWVTRFSRSRVVLALAIFLAAFGVRVLSWHDTRLEVGKVQTTVTENYQHFAQLLRQEGISGFFSSSSSLADTTHLGHPPGYSVFIAVIGSVFGESDTAVQLAQIFFDALCAVIIFLIVTELLSSAAAVIAGLMAAVSPQLAWNAVLLLPDSLSVFPILLAVYLLALARHKPRIFLFIAAGALVGISCWLRANAMLLTFFFAAAVMVCPTNFSLSMPLRSDKLKFVGQRWRYSLAVIGGTILIVAPLTIRNAVVFHRFIPVSLGAGQTLLEGIADYDEAGRFNIPNTDLGIVKQEAEMFQRPDYLNALLNPDGVARERWRLQRGFAVIRSHPFWFAGVMVRRAGSMTRLERTRLISTTPAVTNPLDTANLQPISRPISPSSGNLVRQCTSQSPQAKSTFDSATGTQMFVGDDSNYGKQFACGLLPVRSNFDYVLKLAFKIDQGRMRVSVIDPSERTNVSEILEPLEVKQPAEQPVQTIRLPFVSLADAIQIEFSNEASNAPPKVHMESMMLYELGPARLLWTRPLRLLLQGLQRLFITAVFLPLALFGVAILIVRKRTVALLALSVVLLYYFTVQSAFHTEYRYVLAVNYFLFAFAAVAIVWIVRSGYQKVSSLSHWERVG